MTFTNWVMYWTLELIGEGRDDPPDGAGLWLLGFAADPVWAAAVPVGAAATAVPAVGVAEPVEPVAAVTAPVPAVAITVPADERVVELPWVRRTTPPRPEVSAGMPFSVIAAGG
jgi:hypothetical protein